MNRIRRRRGAALAVLVAVLATSPVARPAEPDTSMTAAGATQDAAALEAATSRLNAYLAATGSLRANFRSVLLDERRVPQAESSGVVLVKRPNRFRWEYQAPAPSLILADGARLWSYDADLEQAVVRDMAELKGANPSNLLGGGAQVSDDFDVIGAYTAGEVEWIDLKPRGSASDFTRVRLGFGDGRIELMELHDQLGQVTQIQLTELETNPELDDGLFTFVPPPGVDVVGAN